MNWNGQAGVNNGYVVWPGQPTSNPYNSPGYHPPGSAGHVDHNAALAAAINRLAAALEKFNERVPEGDGGG